MGFESRISALSFICAGMISANAVAPQIDYALAISLQPNWQEPITFATLGIHQGVIVSTDFLSSHEFILVASGNMRNKANPAKSNFFEAYQISQCEVLYDAAMRRHSVDCSIVNNLWKLRYGVQPGTIKKTSTVDEGVCLNCGWARYDSGPDSTQVAVLREFGIDHISGWIMGEQVFNLLKATTNSSFISRYQSP